MQERHTWSWFLPAAVCLGTNTAPPPRNAALASEHAARTAAERQLAQQRRTLLAQVQAARAEGDTALRRLQHQADVQQRQLEAELDRRVAAAAEQHAVVAAAHAAALQQLEVRTALVVGRWCSSGQATQ